MVGSGRPLRWRGRAALVALPAILLTGALAPGPGVWADAGQGTQVAAQILAAQERMGAATQESARLHAQPAAATAVDQLRQQAQAEEVDYQLRQSLRAEQEAIYRMAADPALQAAALRSLPKSGAAGMAEVGAALRALWRLAGIADPSLVRVRFTHRFRDSEPLQDLSGYYHAAEGRYGVDWGVLAAINYIESDFGRTNGPSSAGALGPMQFLPSTWSAYGQGDIMDPHDSILAAAHYLRRLGAPEDYSRAVLGYNPDRDYVDATLDFAAALDSDPRWLTRLYYWSTYG